MYIKPQHIATLAAITLIALATTMIVGRDLGSETTPPPPPPPGEVETAVFGFG